MNEKVFNDICESCELYDPKFPEEQQCSGYKKLKQMINEGIAPATEEEYKRWETNPTPEELLEIPPLKYLTFLHQNLRTVFRRPYFWEQIKKSIEI